MHKYYKLCLIVVVAIFAWTARPTSDDPDLHQHLRSKSHGMDMWAIVTTTEGKLVKKRVPVPVPKAGEVLVKVKYAPINPSDVYFALRDYNLPGMVKGGEHLNGLEGAGQVVASGGGILLPYIYNSMGARVAFATSKGGSWAEYVALPAMQVVPLPEDVDYKRGSAATVNPLTVIGFLEIAKEGGHKTIVHTAASSALGLMLLRASPEYDVGVVCVVRGEKNEKALVEGMGHPKELVLRSDLPGFETLLAAAVEKTSATLAFDAVSGTLSETIYNAMPAKSNTYVYGLLSGEKHPAHLNNLKDSEKAFGGFHLKAWLDEGGTTRLLGVISTLRGLLSGPLRTEFAEEIDFEDGDVVLEKILEYNTHQKGGKMVIRI